MSDSPFQPPPFEDDDALDEEVLDDEEDTLDDDEDTLDDDDDDDEEEEEGGDGDAFDDDAELARGRGRRDKVPARDDEGGTARAVLEHVARSIVDTPEAVVVEVGGGRSGTKLSLHVDPADMGRIIGKRGRVAQAIRVLVRAAAAHDGTDASVDIVD